MGNGSDPIPSSNKIHVNISITYIDNYVYMYILMSTELYVTVQCTYIMVHLHAYKQFKWVYMYIMVPYLCFCIETCLFFSSVMSGSVHQSFIPSVILTVWTQRGLYDTDQSDHRQVKAFVDLHTPLLILLCVKFFFFFFRSICLQDNICLFYEFLSPSFS